MAESHAEQLRSELAEIRRQVEQCRRDLGIGAPRSGGRRRGGVLHAIRSPRRRAPLG